MNRGMAVAAVLTCSLVVHPGAAQSGGDPKTAQAALTYGAAVDAYRAGHDADAKRMLNQLRPADVRAVVTQLVKHRDVPDQMAAPGVKVPSDAPRFSWDGARLAAAAVLHEELALDAERQAKPDVFAFHSGLAHQLLTAADRTHVGDTAAWSGRSALAAGYMFVLEESPIRARQHFADAVKRRPDDLDLLLAYGTVLETAASGQDAYAGTLAGAPSGSMTRSGPMVQGDLLSRARPVRDALVGDASRVFEHVLALDTASVEARVRLAHLRTMQKDDAQAAALLDQALALRPAADWEYLGHLMRGGIHERAGQLDAARHAYEAALNARPGAQTASLALSHVLALQGDADGAASTLDRLFDERNGNAAVDPWWSYPLGRLSATDATLARLRALVMP